MHHSPSRSFRSIAACAAGLLLLLASRAPAQNPGTDSSRTVVVTAPSPYWGYTYTPYAVRTPLDGVAAIIQAQGDFLVKKEQAALLREEVRREKLKTHREQLEHWEWVRDFRAGALNRELDRYRNGQREYNLKHASVAEIIGAVPLNSLYGQLKERPDLPAAGSTKIEEGWLAHVNFNDSGRGNVGLLKADTIPWPRLLFRSSFSDDRATIEDLLSRGKKLALARPRNQAELADVLDDLEKAVRVCEDRLDQEIHAGVHDPDCNPRHQIEMTRFLREVTNTTFILKKEDAAYYFAPLEGNTVAELVAHMKKHGLLFAPATEGGQRFYVALHSALADEVRRVTNLETPTNKP